MAKVIGVGTGFSGKVGNLVFQSKKGSQIVKTRVVPLDKKSPVQVDKRSIFGELNTIFRPLVPTLIKEFWNPYVTGKRSGWSEILSVNQKLQTGSNIDISKLVISQGSLPSEIITSFSYDSNSGTTRVNWIASGSSGSSDEDIVHIYIYYSLLNLFFLLDCSRTRSNGSARFSIPFNFESGYLTAFLFFSSPAGTPKNELKISNSTSHAI